MSNPLVRIEVIASFRNLTPPQRIWRVEEEYAGEFATRLQFLVGLKSLIEEEGLDWRKLRRLSLCQIVEDNDDGILPWIAAFEGKFENEALTTF